MKTVTRRVSADGLRGCERVEWGYACYRGRLIDGEFKGEHVGVVLTAVDAARWLINGQVRLVPIPPMDD